MPNDIKIDKPKNEPNSTHDKLVSFQSLGFWVRVAEHYKLESKLFDKEFLDSLDFKRYYANNANRFTDKTNLQNYQKVSLLLSLLHNLRNRAFHFENLYKLNNDNKPRLSAKLTYKNKRKFTINLETAKIQVFLNDLIDELSIEV